MERADAGSLRFSWSASDCAGGQNAGIYAGNLATLQTPTRYDHAPLVCQDTFPFLEEELTSIPAGDLYFLVVARNAAGQEGSYGLGDGTNERPMLTGSCAGGKILTCP